MNKKTLKLYVYCQYRIFCGCGSEQDKRTVSEIEKFVHGVPDVITRQILIERYIHGKTWNCVATEIGIPSDSCRKIADRYIEQLQSKDN